MLHKISHPTNFTLLFRGFFYTDDTISYKNLDDAIVALRKSYSLNTGASDGSDRKLPRRSLVGPAYENFIPFKINDLIFLSHQLILVKYELGLFLD